MNHSIDVQITTPLNETEVRQRVEAAISQLFPGADIEERHGELIAETHSLDRFAERLAEQKIQPTAREVLFANRDRDAFSFDLKKAAAHEGVVNFAVGSPDELGDVHVRVRVNEPDVETVIDHVAPTGSDGESAESP